MQLAVRTIPQNAPLQPAPEFIKPNLSGNINFDADQQAARELQQLKGGEVTPQDVQETEGVKDTPASAAKIPNDHTGLIMGIMIVAAIVLLAGWWWFFRRVHKRRSENLE